MEYKNENWVKFWARIEVSWVAPKDTIDEIVQITLKSEEHTIGILKNEWSIFILKTCKL